MPDRTAAARGITGDSKLTNAAEAACTLASADSAFAGANESHQVQGVLIGQLRFDFHQRLIQFEPLSIKRAIRVLEPARPASSVKPAALQAHQIQSLRLDVKTRIEKERRHVEIHARVAADHGETADLRILMDHHAA